MLIAFEGTKMVVTTAHRLHQTRSSSSQIDLVSVWFDRAATLAKQGHVVDKIEIIVLGGTWSAYPRDYQEQFCRDIFYAANTFVD